MLDRAGGERCASPTPRARRDECIAQQQGRRSRCGARRALLISAIEPLESRLLMARFAIIGDLATTSATTLPLVADMVKSWNPQHIVTVGDNNNDGDTNFEATIGQYFHEYMDPYLGSHGPGSTTGNRLWPAMGNHDWDHPDGSLPYTNYFTLPGNERYYNVRFDTVEFFMTDSDTREPDGTTPTSIQGQWLQGALAASTATWKIVISHHPPYSSAGSSDAEWMRWPFQEWGADVVLSGHHHIYERLSVNGLPYIINSAAGASLGEFATIDPNSVVRYDQQGGAIQMDADLGTLTFRFFNRGGTLIDQYSINATGFPTAPTNVTAAGMSDGQIDVSWTDTSDNESNFIIERSPDGVNNWTQVGTTAADITTYSDTSASLLPGVMNHYRVRAALGANHSPNSNVASAAALAPGYVAYAPAGAPWKYYDGGVSQGTAWRNLGFDDSTWQSGRGQFGYGEGDETTIVSFGPDPNAKYITTYFRKSFTVDDPSRIHQLDLRMLRDDGAIVYLNGTEVWRSNMPSGIVGFNTTAADPISGAAETTWLSKALDAGLLVAGANVLAVEVHQERPDSSDMTFDFSLTARQVAPIAPPSAFRATAVSHAQVDLKWIDTAVGEDGFKIERSTDGVNFAQIGTAPAGATTWSDTTTAGQTQYWYRARAYNAVGDSRSSSIARVTTPMAPDAVPAPWSHGDIGPVAAAGSATHNGGLFTVNGSGADIGGTADEFYFVRQPWTGNGTIIARVNGLTHTDPAAKAGLMFRETTATGSRYVLMSITPASGIIISGRGTPDGAASGPPSTVASAPIWLKLVRNGNTFTAQSSSDGAAWTTISSATIAMASNVLVGLAVTSRNDGVINTATFDNVLVSAVTTLSAPLQVAALPASNSTTADSQSSVLGEDETEEEEQARVEKQKSRKRVLLKHALTQRM